MAGGSASHVLHRPAEVYAGARYAYPASVVPGARHDMNASVDALAPCRGLGVDGVSNTTYILDFPSFLKQTVTNFFRNTVNLRFKGPSAQTSHEISG
jgi:hypothetical protein